MRHNRLAACYTAFFILVLATSTYAPVAASTRPKIVLYSVDAGRPDFVMKFAQEGALPNFKRLIDEGFRAEYALSVWPSLTFSAHTSIATGAWPGTHGMTSNTILQQRWPPTTFVRYAGSEVVKAEQVWKTIVDSSLKATVVNWPANWPPTIEATTISGYNPRTALFSRIYTPALTPWSGWSGMSFAYDPAATPKEGSFALFNGPTYNILAFDSKIDGRAEYDTVIVTKDKNLDKPVAVLNKQEIWSKPIYEEIRTFGNVGFMLGILELPSDGSSVRIYQTYGRVSQDFARPSTLEAGILAAAGPVNTGADGAFLYREDGGFTESFYLATGWLSTKWFAETTVYAMKNTEWDLLMTYLPVVDSAEHIFQGYVTEGHSRYNPAFWSVIREVYKMADFMLGRILQSIDANTVVMVTSDHGMVPFDSWVNVNWVLWKAGLVVDKQGSGGLMKGDIDWSLTQAFFFNEGSGGQIIINPNFGNYSAIQTRVLQVLQIELKDQVLAAAKKEEARELGLGADVGDVVFSLKTGYFANEGVKNTLAGIVPTSTTFTGYHAWLPTVPELHAMFFMLGPGIKKETIATIRLVDIAPTISNLLGIRPPKNAEGTAIQAAASYSSVVKATETKFEALVSKYQAEGNSAREANALMLKARSQLDNAKASGLSIPADATQAFESGMRAFQAGDYKAAVAQFNRVLDLLGGAKAGVPAAPVSPLMMTLGAIAVVGVIVVGVLLKRRGMRKTDSSA